MAEVKAQTIALDLAFRWVLARYEIAEGTHADQRLGLAPGDFVTPGQPPAIVATGTNFTRELTSLPGPRAGGRPPYPPRPPNVPVLPDAYRLAVLVEDHRDQFETTSAAERRVCQAHIWLMTELGEGRIAARAEQAIRKVDETEEPIGHGSVPADAWQSCDVDYETASAVLRDGDWEATSGEYKHRGALVMYGVDIDRSALELQLAGIGGDAGSGAEAEIPPPGGPAHSTPRVQAELGMQVVGDDETWVITWKGRECRIAIDGSPVLSRGMRVIAVLLRHQGVPISHHLLEGLNRRPGHGRLQKDKISQEQREVPLIADPLGQKAFLDLITIEVAHERLKEGLLAINPVKPTNIPGQMKDYLSKTSWSGPDGTPAEKGPANPWQYGKRVGENVIKSVRGVIKYIRDCDAQAGMEAARHLALTIRHDSYSCWYDGRQAPVSWSVGPMTGEPWIRRQGKPATSGRRSK